jgi:hypothetical protein
LNENECQVYFTLHAFDSIYLRAKTIFVCKFLLDHNRANTEITIPALSFSFASRSLRLPAGGFGAVGSFGCLLTKFNTESISAIFTP